MSIFVDLVGRQGQGLVFMGKGLEHPQVHKFFVTNINLDKEVDASHHLLPEGYGFKDGELLILFLFKLGFHRVGDLLRLGRGRLRGGRRSTHHLGCGGPGGTDRR